MITEYTGAGGRKLKMYDPIYLNNRVINFLRQWSDVDEDMRPAYSHLRDCGAMWIDPQAEQTTEYPGSLRLTALGDCLKAEVDAQTFNFFRVEDMIELFRAQATPKCSFDMFLRMFHSTDGQVLTEHSGDVRHYLRNVPLAWTTPGEGPRTIMNRLEMIGEAVDRMTKLLRA